jgi:hypothetical protein
VKATISLHDGTLTITGSAPNLVFTRRPSSTDENPVTLPGVRDAMKNVRTHVGSSEHTLEQWIEIALRSCPLPIT